MSHNQPGRRRFLKKSAAAAGLVASSPALALAASAASAGAPAPAAVDNNSLESVLYGRRSRFVTTTREIEGRSHSTTPLTRPVPQRPSARTPLADLVGMITPTSLHFTTQHYYGIPDINPDEHTLMVEGMVDRPLVFTMDDLRRLPLVSRIGFLERIGNRPNPRATTVTLDHRRSVGRQPAHQERAARQGAGRCSRGVRAEWGTGPSRPRLPVASRRTRVRGRLQREVATAYQGRRPALPVVPGTLAVPHAEPEDPAGQL